MGALSGYAVHLNPFKPFPPRRSIHFTLLRFISGGYFLTQLLLFLFNMLPIYPLDGGIMLQAMLWPGLGLSPLDDGRDDAGHDELRRGGIVDAVPGRVVADGDHGDAIL